MFKTSAFSLLSTSMLPVLLLQPACGSDDKDNPSPRADASPGQVDAMPETGGDAWLKVSSGGEHSCAIAPDKTAWCWGDNSNGQLGNGSTQPSLVPVQVQGISNVVDISASWIHTCALSADGTAYCWGSDNTGQLGLGGIGDKNSAAPVKNLDRVTAIAAGPGHSCAVRDDGSAWCWGLGAIGALGNNSFADTTEPVQVKNITDVKDIAVGFVNSCATTNAGKVYCWGENLSLQLGTGGTEDEDSSVPIEIRGAALAGAESISVGDAHICVIANAKVVCWGDNVYGQLGDGSKEDSDTPSVLSGIEGAVSVAASVDHTCAATTNQVYCWGSNRKDGPPNGKIGQPAEVTETLTPLEVSGLSQATYISTGEQTSCATTSSDSFCWGLNDAGQIGNGTTENAFVPMPVTKPMF